MKVLYTDEVLFFMDGFLLWKKNFLGKKDKSNKGEIDKKIKPLVDEINKLDNYFTTSSCSGRICILIEPESESKKDFKFLYQSHDRTNFRDLKKKLEKIPKNKLRFRFESMILHVACKNLDDADSLLKKAKKLFKHSGIISVKDKFVIEIRDSGFIEAVIAINGKLVVNDNYLKILVSEANKKLDLAYKRINLLKKVI